MKSKPQGNGSGEVNIHQRDMGGWVRVFTEPGAAAPDLPIYLSHALTEWFRQHAQFQMRLQAPMKARTVQQFLCLSDEELGRQDVAELNLVCARDLPGCENIDVEGCLRTLDSWAQIVGMETNRLAPRFHAEPSRYENSWSYFRTLVLVTVLQRDLGVRYNPAKIPDEAVFEPSDVFINGVVEGRGGTCASLPVIWAAIGRRLGYPIKLVSTKKHLFARWDAPRERFNIEASGRGLNCFSDDYFRTGRYQLTKEQERDSGAIQSKTPRQELAGFLVERGSQWLERGTYRKAAKCFAWASALAPENKLHSGNVLYTLDRWRAGLRLRMPLISPAVTIHFPPPQFGNMPHSIERSIIATEVVEDLLNNPGLDMRSAKRVCVVYPPRQLWAL
jgi:hypothetical protein